MINHRTTVIIIVLPHQTFTTMRWSLQRRTVTHRRHSHRVACLPHVSSNTTSRTLCCLRRPGTTRWRQYKKMGFQLIRSVTCASTSLSILSTKVVYAVGAMVILVDVLHTHGADVQVVNNVCACIAQPAAVRRISWAVVQSIHACGAGLCTEVGAVGATCRGRGSVSGHSPVHIVAEMVKIYSRNRTCATKVRLAIAQCIQPHNYSSYLGGWTWTADGKVLLWYARLALATLTWVRSITGASYIVSRSPLSGIRSERDEPSRRSDQVHWLVVYCKRLKVVHRLAVYWDHSDSKL